MGRKRSNVVGMKAPIYQRRESTNDVSLKDAQIKFETVECALSTRQNSNYAAVKDARIIPNEEEYVRDTVHIATIPKNLLLLQVMGLHHHAS